MTSPTDSNPAERRASLSARFDALVASARDGDPVAAAVVYPCSAPALEGAIQASEAGLIRPLLVGPRALIERIAEAEGLALSRAVIVEAHDPLEAACRGAALAKDGGAQIIMKGSLHTDELMSVVVARETGLRTQRRITHAFVLDVPSHDRLLLVADAAVNIAPDLKAKRDIAQNTIDLAHALGISEPRVAILSAVESVNPDIPSTVDAAALCKMAERGQITGAVLDGPLAFDNAISVAAAKIKGIESPVAGAADILLVPDIEAGNILFKASQYLARAIPAGVVLGAKVPIVLTSRADSPASRTVSAALAVLLTRRAAR